MPMVGCLALVELHKSVYIGMIALADVSIFGDVVEVLTLPPNLHNNVDPISHDVRKGT